MPRCALLFFLLLAQTLQATPETFDHLAPYKQLKPTHRGPVLEKVIQGKSYGSANYEYDSENRLVKARFFTGDIPDGETIYRYGRWGLETEEVFDRNGNLVEKLTYRYTREGKPNGYQVSDAAGNEVIRWDFTLTAGEISAGRRYSGKELTESFQMTSENGNRVQVLYNGQGEKQGEITYVYQAGKLTERLKNDVTGKKKITYGYDFEGRLSTMTYWIYEKEQWQLTKEHLLHY